MPAESDTSDQQLGVDAVRALARVARVLERATAGLGMAQYRVLSAIASGEGRASRVARRFALGKPTVSAAVEALCRDGLVERKESADDQRAVELSLTAAGSALLESTEVEMVRELERLCELTSWGRDAVAMLAQLGDAVDEVRAERGVPGDQALPGR